jgi:ATP-dependent DNA helicase RecQ
MVVKTAANKSAIKVAIIQNIDRKIPLDDIAKAKGFTLEQMMTEIETIVSSGTKLNLNYYIDELIDEDRQDEVFDYFRQADSDSIDSALSDLGEEDYTREEIQLMRIKFMSELGN